MAKATATTKKVKVKKVRTPEEKAARALRRKQKRENNKSTGKLKGKIEFISMGVTTPKVDPIFAKKVTSDGLPFSKSIDNPDSLIAQMAKLAETEAAEKVAAEAKSKIVRTGPKFIGMSKEAICYTEIA